MDINYEHDVDKVKLATGKNAFPAFALHLRASRKASTRNVVSEYFSYDGWFTSVFVFTIHI